MIGNSTDLTSILTLGMGNDTRHSLNAGMGTPGGNVRYGQGLIVSWNETTFNNVVEFRGSLLTDLPVLSGTDALTYQVGDTVAIMSWSPQGGAGVYWILGRLITPGSDRAAQTIAWMTSSLGRAIAAAVFADGIKTDSDSATGSRTSAGFGNLDGPAVQGPEVTIELTEVGRAVVFVSAWTQLNLASATSINEQVGIVSARVSGQSTVASSVFNSKYLRYRNSASPMVADITDRSTAVLEFTGLNSGDNTFTMEYSSDGSDSRSNVIFSERQITVFGF